MNNPSKSEFRQVNLPPDTPLVQVKRERSSQSEEELKINTVRPNKPFAGKLPMSYYPKPIAYELDSLKNVQFDLKIFQTKSALLQENLPFFGMVPLVFYLP
jgi:hypothetical protein